MGVNYRNKDFFYHRFKRVPKMWTIEDMHKLWLKTLERTNKRRDAVNEHIKKIVAEIPIDSKGEHIAYYIHDNCPDELQYYAFSFHREFDTYAYSNNTFKPSDNKKQSRDEKLFQMLNPLAFELGQQFYELKKLDPKLHYIVHRVMWDEIQEILRDKYKKTRPPEVFTIDLCGHTYFVKTDSDNRGNWAQFKLCDEFSPTDTIKIDHYKNGATYR